jgi:hypothetical protein
MVIETIVSLKKKKAGVPDVIALAVELETGSNLLSVLASMSAW